MSAVVKGYSNGPSLPVPVSPRGDYTDHSSPSGLLWILRRRLTLIVLTMAIVIGATAVVLMLTTPVYRATAVMQIDETSVNAERSETAPPSVREIEQQLDYEVRVQIEALKSRAVAERVVADLQLYNVPEFNPKGYKPLAAKAVASTPRADVGDERDDRQESGTAAPASDPIAAVPPAVIEDTTDALQKQVSAEQAGATNFIRVTAESSDPDMATKIANAVVQAYVATRTEDLADNNRRQIEDIGARTEELSERLKTAEYRVANFKRDKGIDSSFAVGAGAAQIQGAAAEVASARGASAEAAAVAARQRMAGSATSGLLTSLRSQESELKAKLANLSTQYGARHPEVMSVTAELRIVQGAVAAEAARAAANVQSASDGASARAGYISSELGGLRAKARSQDLASPELASLEREVETSKSLYLGMLERVKELQIRGANPTPEALPVSEAIVPVSPSYPKPFQSLSVAFVSSIVLGIFLALIVDSFDNRVRSGDQIERLTALPTFTMIPQRGTIPQRLDGPDETIAAPKSIFAEAFRGGFLEILARTSGENSRVIMIASALPGEGKTTVSLGTAFSALSQGMSAIALDFDFRRRGMTKTLGLQDSAAGLDTYLMGTTSLEDSICYPGKGGGIASMPVTAVPDDPSGLFEPEKLATLFEALRSQFDFIVIDTPPIMALRDAKVLAAFSDASVMTARWGASTPDTVRSVTKILGDVLIGVIITRVDYTKHARFGYGDAVQHYSKYSAYYNDNDDLRPGLVRRWLSKFRDKLSAA